MSNILLIEPDYKNKYPPLGLMKISYFHKNVLHDYVRFTKGRLPNDMSGMKWDHVYVTTLFTFEWDKEIEAIEYAKTLVDTIDQITVGGIAATMLPDEFYEATGIHPVCGLLDEPGKLGLPGDECIDQIVPDYSILDDIDYVYPFHDAYFLSATKGCGNNCGFCAVQTLEPKFVPYIDIKEKIAAIDREFGPKKDLLLMDNNVLRSRKFPEIIKDIIDAGFGKDATYISPQSGKRVRRYVDFNQGLDAVFLTERKAELLGSIALRPARIAFDHIEDRETYEKSLRLCAKNGITYLSNYVLYNSEDFGGKGQQYAADTPADLYYRMRITLDIQDDINKDRSGDDLVKAFSFPMRYIPLDAHHRGYVGSKWNPKFLRAVQCMMIPTAGKGVGSRSFFEADFGKDSSEFERFICMPEQLIAARGEFGSTARSRHYTEEVGLLKKAVWEKNQRKLQVWNSLFDQLDKTQEDFISLIADNSFQPENVLTASTALHKKLYVMYLTVPKLFSLLGMIDINSPTYGEIKSFVLDECPDLYDDMLEYLLSHEVQHNYEIANYISFFGTDGLTHLLEELGKNDFNFDRQLQKWNDVCKKSGYYGIDFELIRVYRRYVETNSLAEPDHRACKQAILRMDMSGLAIVLDQNRDEFRKRVNAQFENDQGQTILRKAADAIMANIQIKISQFLGE